jgi:hypothetical protein
VSSWSSPSKARLVTLFSRLWARFNSNTTGKRPNAPRSSFVSRLCCEKIACGRPGLQQLVSTGKATDFQETLAVRSSESKQFTHKIVKYLSVYTASHAERFEYSLTLLREPQISQKAPEARLNQRQEMRQLTNTRRW